jgi:hypothetical protein
MAGIRNDGFEARDEPMDGYHFCIQGVYKDDVDEFYFIIEVNPEIEGTTLDDFLKSNSVNQEA